MYLKGTTAYLQLLQLNPPNPNMHLKHEMTIIVLNYFQICTIIMFGLRKQLTAHTCRSPTCIHLHILKQRSKRFADKSTLRNPIPPYQLERCILYDVVCHNTNQIISMLYYYHSNLQSHIYTIYNLNVLKVRLNCNNLRVITGSWK